VDKFHPALPLKAPDVQKPPLPGGGIESLRQAEEKVLQMISARAPIAKILDEICLAADHQIGDLASYISRPEDDKRELSAIATMVVYYRLHIFCCEDIFGENGQVLGSLEMFSGVPRKPTCEELETIAWAKYLAALVIKLDQQATVQTDSSAIADLPVQASVREWAESSKTSSACKSPTRAGNP
jgi:hypothetical protein